MAEHKSDQEKTEKATPKKRQDARKKGQVAIFSSFLFRFLRYARKDAECYEVVIC
jgi:flagellar biosynthesis protein FlhB